MGNQRCPQVTGPNFGLTSREVKQDGGGLRQLLFCDWWMTGAFFFIQKLCLSCQRKPNNEECVLLVSLLAYIHKLLSFFTTLKFLFRHCRISCLVVAESELLVGLVLLSVASAGPVSLCVSFLVVPCFLAVVSFSELFIFLRYLPLRSI